MGDIGFWVFLTFLVAVSHIEEIGDAFKEDCVSVVQEVEDGAE
jgi:hypothetical protein